MFFYLSVVAISSPNQSLLNSNAATPQKPIKIDSTPQKLQPRQPLLPMPTARTPINVRSLPQSMQPLVTPSYGQYRIASPTPVVGMSKVSCDPYTSIIFMKCRRKMSKIIAQQTDRADFCLTFHNRPLFTTFQPSSN